METCCQDTRDMDCVIQDILRRITPIKYSEDGQLIINSDLSVLTSLVIEGVPITGTGGVLALPEDTTVGGIPLLSPQYVDGVYVLPTKTNIDGFPILNTNYFYYYTTNNQTFQVFQSGCFINNTISTSSVASTSFIPNYPFLVPGNCVLTSLLFSMVIGAGASTITNATATLYTMSSSNTVVNTGISVIIPACPVNSRNFGSTSFQYAVQYGDRVGVRVTYTGTSTAIITAFATLGYNFP